MGDELSTDVIGEISDLINKGAFKAAAELARSYEDSELQDSAHFWFQYGLARNGAGLNGAKQYIEATYCDDCTDGMKADINRDLALLAAHMGEFSLALEYLLVGLDFVSDDDFNRLAATHMIGGRVVALDGQYGDALEHHVFAHRIWQQAGDDADPQWIMNNRFYWLRTAALLERPRHGLYKQLKASPEPRADRRRQAAGFLYAGPVAAGLSLAREISDGRMISVRTAIDDTEFLLSSVFDTVYD